MRHCWPSRARARHTQGLRGLPVAASCNRASPVFLSRHHRRHSSHQLAAVQPPATDGKVQVLVGGHMLELSPLWLRLQDPKQFTPNGQRLLEISTVATDLVCTTVLESSSDSCSLRVKFGDGEETSFPMEWLEKQVKHAGIIGSDGSARSDDANAKPSSLTARVSTCYSTHFRRHTARVRRGRQPTQYLQP